MNHRDRRAREIFQGSIPGRNRVHAVTRWPLEAEFECGFFASERQRRAGERSRAQGTEADSRVGIPKA